MMTVDFRKYKLTHYDGTYWHLLSIHGKEESDEVLVRRFRCVTDGITIYFGEKGSITPGRASVKKYGIENCNRHIGLQYISQLK